MAKEKKRKTKIERKFQPTNHEFFFCQFSSHSSIYSFLLLSILSTLSIYTEYNNDDNNTHILTMTILL